MLAKKVKEFQSLDSANKFFEDLKEPHDLFLKIERIENTFPSLPSIFGIIIELRESEVFERTKKKPPNIDHLLRSKSYTSIIRKPVPQSEMVYSPIPYIMYRIEREAIRFFANIAEAWGAYEMHKIQSKTQSKSTIVPFPTNIGNKKISSEIVPSIEEDVRLFCTTGISAPCDLSEATAFQFLRLAIRKKWWEALYCLDLSTKGQHAICYKNQKNNFSELFSTALIQDIPSPYSPEENTLLTRSDFFRTQEWTAQIAGNEVREVLKTYFDEHNNFSISSPQIDCSLIPDSPCSLTELEEGIISAIDPSNISEFIRLTVEGDRKSLRKNIFTALREIFGAQTQNSKLVSFSVTEEKMILDMFQILEVLTERKCFLITSKNIIEDDSQIETHKIITLNANLWRSMSEVGYQTIIESLKMLRKGIPLNDISQMLKD